MQISQGRPIERFPGRKPYIKWILFLVLGLIIAVLVVAFVQVRSVYQKVDVNADNISVTIDTGSGTKVIALQLFEEGLIVSERAFTLAVLISSAHGELQAGTYELSAAMSAKEMVAILRDGQTKEITVTIPEGLRLVEIAELYSKAGLLESDEFLQATQDIGDYDFSFLATAPVGADLEGFLFPDTYTFRPEATAEEVVIRMLENFESKIGVFLSDIASSDMSLFEIVNLASLIEGEVPHAQDRPIVASVFLNRLEIGMPLQADSTLAFITGKDRIDFTNEDTLIDDPYNTYQNTGLPPGPINSPGITSIESALNPDDTDFLFFVSDPETAETFFTETLEEHNTKVQEVLGDF